LDGQRERRKPSKQSLKKNVLSVFATSICPLIFPLRFTTEKRMFALAFAVLPFHIFHIFCVSISLFPTKESLLVQMHFKKMIHTNIFVVCGLNWFWFVIFFFPKNVFSHFCTYWNIEEVCPFVTVKNIVGVLQILWLLQNLLLSKSP
jgi:hypothetical protein